MKAQHGYTRQSTGKPNPEQATCRTSRRKLTVERFTCPKYVIDGGFIMEEHRSLQNAKAILENTESAFDILANGPYLLRPRPLFIGSW